MLCLAALVTVVSWLALAGTAQAVVTITVGTPQPASIAANGTSTSQVTATLTDDVTGLVINATVTFSGTLGVTQVGSTTNNGDGTYTATMKSSTQAGQATITATDGTTSGSGSLTLDPGPVATVTVALNPASIIAKATSSTTATATVTDANGNRISGQTVVFSTSDTAGTITGTDAGNGTYTATIAGTPRVGTRTITATDGVASLPATLTQTLDPLGTITVTLNPTSIIANGTSSTTATATVKDSTGAGVSGDAVKFLSSDTGEIISATTDAGNGTYTATITSSKTVGAPTISATDGTLVGGATLTQTVGPAAFVAVHVNPTVIIANRVSTAVATATVTDAAGHPLSSENVGFSSTDPNQFFGPVSNKGNGNYSVQILSSTTVGTATITATDGTVSGKETLVQSAGPSATSITASPSDPVTNEIVTFYAAVGSASRSPSGTITFSKGTTQIPGCVRRAITPLNPTATCQTSFAASTSPVSVTATFTPDSTSLAPGSRGSTTLTVAPDPTSVSLRLPTTVVIGRRTTYTAVVSPAGGSGPMMPSGSVTFFDRGKRIQSCRSRKVVNARATCAVTYHAFGAHRITARYFGDPNFNGSASAARTVNVGPVHARGTITSTMQWTFRYTPAFTTILVFVVNGASAESTVAVTCQGGGCPFATRTVQLAKPKGCGQKGKRACPASGTINLAPAFRNHRLSVGTKITVLIRRPVWIGKYYTFRIRARRPPAIDISCMAPGSSRPGAGCSA